LTPWAPPHPCAEPGCSATLPRGVARCARHRLPRWDDRPNAGQRGYGQAWRVRRARILARDGRLCVPCRAEGRLTPATMVDHVTPKHLGGGDDDANLRAICRRCHDRKTAREGRLAR
jgi:5-methylcytosine-specific restriction protein A